MDFRIGFATTDEEREAIYRLRYRLYTEEQHLFVDLADHERRTLQDDDDRAGRLLLATVGDEVVGTARLNWGGDAPFSAEHRETYDLDRFEKAVSRQEMMVVSRLIVTPEHRGGIIPLQLMVACAQFGVSKEMELGFCDCEPHLVGLYERLGFRSYRSLYNHPTNGLLVPMVIVAADLDHLERVRSPLLHELRARTRDLEVGQRILELIPDSKPVQGSELVDPDLYWSEVASWLESIPRENPSLFDDLTREEAERLLRRSHVLVCSRGDAVIRTGQVARTLFVVLSGTLEVRDGERVVGVAKEGEVVGEVAFLMSGRRMADVYSATDEARVLALNERTLNELIESDARIAAKLLLSFSRGLCVKLIERSQGARIG